MENDKNISRELQEAVWQVVGLIPKGRATSYGAIARAAGYPTYTRLVGHIMSRIPPHAALPAHRVVNSQGRLSGASAFGPDRMARLLESEGVRIENGRIRKWKEIFWDPLLEL